MRKLKLFFACMLMTVLSVGQVWAEKITRITDIVSGNSYYIGATTSNTDYYFKVATTAANSVAGTAVTDINEAVLVTLTQSGSNWTIQFANGNYLALANSKANGKVNVVTSATNWTFANQGEDKIRMKCGNTYALQKNSNGTQFGSYACTVTDVWLEPAGTSQVTVSAVPNDNSYGSVEVSGMTITATPNSGYRVIAGDGGYTVTAGDATVVNNGDNTFTVTATEDCTVRINFEAIPPCTVTFDAGTGSLSCPSCNQNNQLTETLGGAGITLPTATPSSNCVQAGWEFYGWAESAVASTTNEPTLVEQANGKYYPTQNCTLHAVYKVVEGASGSTETVTFSDLYTTTTDVEVESPIDIGDNFATVSFSKGGNSSNGPKFYVDATNGNAVRCYAKNTFTVSANTGNITAIALTFTAGGSNALTASKQTYDDSKGTWAGEESEVTFTVGGTSGQRRIASIEVTIGNPGTTTYNSNPSCEAPSVEQPTFDLTDPSYTEPKTLHLSSTSEGAVIYYNITNDGTNPTDPTNASTLYVAANGISLDARKTYKIKAIAYVGENHSSIASATYTINLPYETAAELQDDATSTKKSVQVVFDEWIVTHIYTKTSNNNEYNNVYVVDGNNHGLVIYGSAADLAFAVGDRLSGTVTAGLQKYSGVTELLDMTKAMVTTVTAGSVIPTVVTDFSTIDATNEGALVTLKDATYNSSNTALSDGTHTIPYYNTFALTETPDNGTKYDFTGIITKHNATYQIAPRSAADMALATSSEFNVSSNVEGCTADANNPTTVSISADALELVYTLTEGYKWGTPVVTMGSVTLAEDEDYTWEVEGTAGTLTIMQDAFSGAINVTLNCEEDYGDYTFYNFAFSKIGTTGWSNSYSDKTLEYSAANVTLKGASKQGSTVTDVPVTKGSDVTIVLKDANKKISEVEFTCEQWSDKTQTITLWYSTNGGTTYQELNPSVTSSNFKISILDPNKLPNKVNALKFTFSSSNQVGIASAKLLIEDLIIAHPTVTLATNDEDLGLVYMEDENGVVQSSGFAYTEDDQFYIHTILGEGCKLKNLALSEDNGGASLTIENGDTILTVGTKNVTVTGTFAQYYTVSFNKNTTADVDNIPASVEVESGESFTLPTEQLTLTGKVFKGWNTNQNALDGLTGSITISEATELFAIWADPTDCTVKYYVNGVVVEEIDDLQQGETFNANKTLTEQQIPDGYEFEGWALEAYPNDELSITTVTSFTLPAVSEQPLYAVFSRTSQAAEGVGDFHKLTEAPSDWKGTYLIVYETGSVAFNGGLETLDVASNTIAVTISNGVIAASSTINDATFTIGEVTEDNVTSNTILSVSGLYIGQTSDANGLASNATTQYANTLSIDESGNAVIVSSGAYMRYNSDNNQQRFRYYKSSGYTNQKAIALYKKNTGVIVYTTNAVAHKLITFNINGGTGDICSSIEVPAGGTATLCNATPTLEGYDFVGWNTAADGTGATYTTTIENVADDIELWAKWNKAKYVVTVSAENGTVTLNPALDANNKAEYEAEIEISCTPSEEYAFKSVQVYKTGDQETIVPVDDNKFTMPAYAVTVAATFESEEVIEYTISYDANGGVGTMEAETVTGKGSSYTVKANTFTKTLATFAGWNTQADGTGLDVAAGATINVTSDMTLYAQWEVTSAAVYTVTSTSAVTTSGAIPAGSSATYSSTYSSKCQLTKDNTMTLTLSGYAGKKITAIVLSMRSNASKGAGYLSVKAGTTTLATIGSSNSGVDFNNAAWNGSWSTSYVPVEVTLSNANYAINKDEDVVIEIGATANSLYCESFTIAYEDVPAIEVSGDQNISDLTGLQKSSDIVVPDGAVLTVDVEKEMTSLTVETGGVLALADKTLTIDELIIQAEGSESSQMTGVTEENVNAGVIYYEKNFVAEAYHWYNIGVPFKVNIAGGIQKTDGTELLIDRDFDFYYYDGSVRASQGTVKQAWVKETNYLQPGVNYMCVFDQPFGSIRFKKEAGETLNNANLGLDITAYSASNGVDGGWNGLANTGLTYASATSINVTYIYVLNEAGDRYINYLLNNAVFVVGTPFFVQATVNQTNVTFGAAVDEGIPYAPQRVEGFSIEPVAVELKQNNKMIDRLYVTASEDATTTYEVGKDLAKFSESTTAAQLWVNNYNVKLSANDVPLVNNQAIYDLGLYAPAAGTYSISAQQVEGATLYVTYNGAIVWNLSLGDYELDLTRGTTTGYGLLLVAQPNQMPTGLDTTEGVAGDAVQKILLNGQLYILRDGHLFDAVGHEMK